MTSLRQERVRPRITLRTRINWPWLSIRRERAKIGNWGCGFRETGELMARSLTGVIRLVSIHDKDNQAFDAPVAMLSDAIEHARGIVGNHSSRAGRGTGLRQRHSRSLQVLRRHRSGLVPRIRGHSVGGLSIHRPATDRELRVFLEGMGEKPPERGNPRKALQFF